jgi:hypothetical protein
MIWNNGCGEIRLDHYYTASIAEQRAKIKVCAFLELLLTTARALPEDRERSPRAETRQAHCRNDIPNSRHISSAGLLAAGKPHLLSCSKPSPGRIKLSACRLALDFENAGGYSDHAWSKSSRAMGIAESDDPCLDSELRET